MDLDVALGLLLAAVVANAMIVGASLDQAIKQLPARHRIGVRAFAAYSQAADLWHGLVLYPVLGVGTALITLAAAAAGLTGDAAGAHAAALTGAAAGTVGHTLVTAVAAPTNFSQRRVAGDEAALARVFDRFARLNALRAAVQTITLGLVVWALVAAITADGQVGDHPMLLRLLIGAHILAGLTAVVAGAGAMRSPKRSGPHPRRGRTYLLALLAVVATATTLAIWHWPRDVHLLILAVVALGTAGLGYTARRRRWRGWRRHHILGMAVSYLTMLTAFYVDNGPTLPVWNLLPPLSFWFLPTAIGLPVLLRALARHTPTRRHQAAPHSADRKL